jgi:hypothetical protein
MKRSEHRALCNDLRTSTNAWLPPCPDKDPALKLPRLKIQTVAPAARLFRLPNFKHCMADQHGIPE